MVRLTRRGLSVAGGILLAGLSLPQLLGAPPATRPAWNGDTLRHDLNDDTMKLIAALPEDENVKLSDPTVRRQLAEKVVPIARHALGIIDQLPPDCHGHGYASMKVSWEPMLIALDDKATVDQAKHDAAGTGEPAVLARVCLAMADRLLAGDDRSKADAAASRVLDEAKAHPADDAPSLALVQLSDDDGVSTAVRSAAADALASSPSGVAATLRFVAKQAATTRPA